MGAILNPFLATCTALSCLLPCAVVAQSAAVERTLVLPRDGSLVLRGKPPNIYCSVFSPSIDIRPMLEEGFQALLPGSRVSTGAFVQGGGRDAPIRVVVDHYSWECTKEGDIIARLALGAQRTTGGAWSGRASGERTGKWPGARECGTIPCAEQKFRQFFDPIVNALAEDMVTRLAGQIRDADASVPPAAVAAGPAPVVAKAAAESVAEGQGIPLYEVASPLLKADRAAAREIVREAADLLTAAAKAPRAGEHSSLASELDRLIHLQVLLGERSAYAQSISSLVELESRDPGLTVGIGGNSRVEKLIPAMLRAGDQRMAKILANAQVRVIRSKPEWSSLHEDLVAFLEKILDPADEVLGVLNFNAPTRLLCSAVTKLASIGRYDVAIRLLDRIGPARVTSAQCILLEPAKIAGGDPARFKTYLAAVTAALTVDPQVTVASEARDFASRMAVAGRFEAAREFAGMIPDRELAGRASAVLSAALLQAGRPTDALAAYLASGRGGQAFGEYGMATLPCILEGMGDPAGARASFDHAIRGRGIAESWKGCLAEDAGRYNPKRFALRGDIRAAVAASREWGKQMASGGSTQSEQLWVSRLLLDVAFIAAGDTGLYDIFSRQ